MKYVPNFGNRACFWRLMLLLLGAYMETVFRNKMRISAFHNTLFAQSEKGGVLVNGIRSLSLDFSVLLKPQSLGATCRGTGNVFAYHISYVVSSTSRLYRHPGDINNTCTSCI